MRTILTAIRVADAARSTAFYSALGYEVVGRVPDAPVGALTMLKLPDEEFVSLELVAAGAGGTGRAGGTGSGLDHIAVQVDDVTDVRATLLDCGIRVGEVEAPGGPDGPRTCAVVDPDGYRIEFVQWPPGHPVGMSPDDFA